MLLQTFQIIYLLSNEKIMTGGDSKEKSPSKKEKHDKGKARRKQDQDVTAALI